MPSPSRTRHAGFTRFFADLRSGLIKRRNVLRRLSITGFAPAALTSR
jgi:hypothetical protein